MFRLACGGSAQRWRIHEWVEYGLDDGQLEAAAAQLDDDCRANGVAGLVDETMASFDENERWIADLLAAEGHIVFALPVNRRAGVPAPDAIVSGLLTEFKTYGGSDPRQLISRVQRARRQSNRVVVGVSGNVDSSSVAAAFTTRVTPRPHDWLLGLKVVGESFHYEWGSWNRHIP